MEKLVVDRLAALAALATDSALAVPVSPVPAPLKVLAVTLPVTDKETKVPTDVILGCAAVANVPVMPALAMMLAACMLPATDKAVSVPRPVMLFCVAVIKVPTMPVLAMMLPPVMLPGLDILILATMVLAIKVSLLNDAALNPPDRVTLLLVRNSMTLLPLTCMATGKLFSVPRAA